MSIINTKSVNSTLVQKKSFTTLVTGDDLNVKVEPTGTRDVRDGTPTSAAYRERAKWDQDFIGTAVTVQDANGHRLPHIKAKSQSLLPDRRVTADDLPCTLGDTASVVEGSYRCKRI